MITTRAPPSLGRDVCASDSENFLEGDHTGTESRQVFDSHMATTQE